MNKTNKLLFLSLSLLLTNCNYKEDNSLSNSIENSETINDSSNIENDDSFDNNTSTDSTQESIDSSSSTIIEDSSSIEEDYFVSFDKQIKIYINPSVQYSNLYADGLGNEGVYMNSISKILVGMLNKHTNLIVYSNNALPGKSLSESVKESNALKVDYHLALHSNAGGGKGSEGFYTNTSYGFTKSILDSMQQILPYNTRGAKYGQNALYELKRTTASASLIEILFHDDKAQALFIINNQEEIAKAIFEGIVSYLS